MGGGGHGCCRALPSDTQWHTFTLSVADSKDLEHADST